MVERRIVSEVLLLTYRFISFTNRSELPLNHLIESEEQWQEFVLAFESGTLPKEAWTHQAHFIVGLWFVLKHSSNEALDLLRNKIRSYNEATGGHNSDTSGYHETLTRLYVVGISDFINQQSRTGVELLAALLAAPITKKSWPLQFYSRERLMSVEARRTWITPDLAPLANDCFE